MKNNFKKDDLILNEILKTLGEWRDTVVIGGGYALIIFRLYFNVKNAPAPVSTRDLDSILPRKISKTHATSLSQKLLNAGFRIEYKDFENPATEVYCKRINKEEIELEFLTDALVRKEKYKNVSISGVVAQPLSYIEMSYENILSFTTSTGAQGKVVDPGAWIFHKLLTFTTRRENSKFFKDLYGIWYIATQLENFSEFAVKHFYELSKARPAWFKKAKSNIKKWYTTAAPEEWSKLKVQDPTGTLDKPGFIHALKLLKVL